MKKQQFTPKENKTRPRNQETKKQKKQKKQNVRAQVRGSLLIFLGVCNLVFFGFLIFWFFGFLVSWFLVFFTSWLPSFALPPSFFWQTKKQKKQKQKTKKHNVRAQVSGSLLIFLGVCNLVIFVFLVVLFFGFLVSCVLHIMAAFLRAASKLLLTSSLWRARPLPYRHPNHMANLEDDFSLGAAIEATEHLVLRELASHVFVGPLPLGAVTPLTLPVKEFLANIFIVSGEAPRNAAKSRLVLHKINHCM